MKLDEKVELRRSQLRRGYRYGMIVARVWVSVVVIAGIFLAAKYVGLI